jgi:ATP-dependent Lon protease
MSDPTDTREGQPAANSAGEKALPQDALIIIPVRQAVLFPGLVVPLAVSHERSIAAIQEAMRKERPVGVLLQRDPEIEEPGPEQLHGVGSSVELLRYVKAGDGSDHAIFRGVSRFRVIEFLPGYPFLVARVEEVGVSETVMPEIEARVRLLRERAHEAMQLVPNVPAEMRTAIDSLTSPSALTDVITGLIDATPTEKQDILETFDVKERLDKVLTMIGQRSHVLKLSKEIGEQTQQSLSEQQRQHILREQLRHIQKKLGEGDDKSQELAELRDKIGKAGMPKEAEEQAKKELKRLRRMPESSAGVRDDPRLSRLADRAALVTTEPRAHRYP